ncbi:MAG: twin-arginine translocase subunit TatC [Anaerolineae bacterium]|nr:twin-arginine translocase subunit TatC [Anaerolineae bacterium]
MNKDGPLTILGHIEELRQRLLRALISLVIGTSISAIFARRLLEWLAMPVGGIEQLRSIEVTENITVFMQVSLLGGAALAMPYIVYQLWRFFSPGLTRRENRYVLILVPFATLLFLSGAAFSYFVMLPAAVPFLTGFLGIKTEPRPADYISFITSLMFWIGVSFEIPLVIFFLAKVRIVNHRMLLRNWRTAIFAMAVLAAFVTPTPDPVNMGLVMIPLIILYGLSVILARIAYRPAEESE